MYAESALAAMPVDMPRAWTDPSHGEYHLSSLLGVESRLKESLLGYSPLRTRLDLGAELERLRPYKRDI